MGYLKMVTHGGFYHFEIHPTYIDFHNFALCALFLPFFLLGFRTSRFSARWAGKPVICHIFEVEKGGILNEMLEEFPDGKSG